MCGGGGSAVSAFSPSPPPPPPPFFPFCLYAFPAHRWSGGISSTEVTPPLSLRSGRVCCSVRETGGRQGVLGGGGGCPGWWRGDRRVTPTTGRLLRSLAPEWKMLWLLAPWKLCSNIIFIQWYRAINTPPSQQSITSADWAIFHRIIFTLSLSLTHTQTFFYFFCGLLSLCTSIREKMCQHLESFARVIGKKGVMIQAHLQACAMKSLSPYTHTCTCTCTHTHTHTHTHTTSVPPCLQSLSLAAVLQGVNVKLSKLDETLWEILWGSLLLWWLEASG